MEILTALVDIIGISGLLFSTFIILLLLGAPISVALGVAATCTLIATNKGLGTLITLAYGSMNNFPIMALPAFVLAGALMEGAGMSRRLVRFAESIVGPTPGGLAISTALGCVFFGAISGSGPATTAAVGMLLIPAMIKRNYDPAYAAASAATAGGVGIIIPPSIPMVIYGVASNKVSITDMFLAGVIPGLLISFGLIAMHRYRCRHMEPDADIAARSLKNIISAFTEGFWSILAPVVILGGIYTGFFTPTEAAVVAIFYTLFIGVFVYRELALKPVLKALETTSWLVGRVLIILFTASAFGRVLVENRIPDQIVEAIQSITNNVAIVWIFVVVVLLFLGMFMETLAIILLVTPVLLPVMMDFGVHPIHFGVVLVCCCGVGFSTPPLGENMFIASGIADVSLEKISSRALPFCAVTVGVIFLIVMFPQLVLFLPEMLKDMP